MLTFTSFTALHSHMIIITISIYPMFDLFSFSFFFLECTRLERNGLQESKKVHNGEFTLKGMQFSNASSSEHSQG